MKAIRPSYWILFWCIILCTISTASADTNQFDRAINAITQSLPSGWIVAKQKPDEIPWGHHWNQNYTGPKGLLLIVKGTRPVNAEFRDTNNANAWHSIHVATESLEIWLMPSNYSDSFGSKFAIGRPIQPTVVVAHGPIKVYAEPSHLLLSEKEFWETLHKFNGIRWPDSPGNNPALLTWKNWQSELKEAINKEFSK